MSTKIRPTFEPAVRPAGLLAVTNQVFDPPRSAAGTRSELPWVCPTWAPSSVTVYVIGPHRPLAGVQLSTGCALLV